MGPQGTNIEKVKKRNLFHTKGKRGAEVRKGETKTIEKNESYFQLFGKSLTKKRGERVKGERPKFEQDAKKGRWMPPEERWCKNETKKKRIFPGENKQKLRGGEVRAAKDRKAGDRECGRSPHRAGNKRKGDHVKRESSGGF